MEKTLRSSQNFRERESSHHGKGQCSEWKQCILVASNSIFDAFQIFDRLIAQDAKIMSVFYRSAFIKCIEDRRNRCRGKSIATLRDHAHILIDFIDGVLAMMFDEPLTKPVFDPVSVGRIHARLNPLGFDRHIWLKLGECFAEVMFSQDCVRGYPHAASAWSTLAVACTDKMFTNGKIVSFELLFKH